MAADPRTGNRTSPTSLASVANTDLPTNDWHRDGRAWKRTVRNQVYKIRAISRWEPARLWHMNDRGGNANGDLGAWVIGSIVWVLCWVASVGQPKKLVVERSWQVDRLAFIGLETKVVYKHRLARGEDLGNALDALRSQVDGGTL